ncbi:hypothetical protein ABPG73_004479 [Tetrahymena malaccensis]
MTKSVLVDENEAAENNQRIQIPIQTFKQLKSLSVLNQGNSIDQKQGSSPQQNLLSLDNQTSLTQSNATFQPQQDSNDIINKFNRDSPLLLFKGNMLKRDFTQSQNQMTNKRHQQNSFSQKSQIQTLNQEQAEDVNKNKSNIAQFKEKIVINQIDQSMLIEENEEIENNQEISIPQFKHLNSQSVFRNGQSFDQKLNSSPQQNLLQQDNQTSISNVLLQPHQELSQVFTKHSRNSPPLKSFQSDKVKKEKSQQKELQSQQISLFLQRFQCQQNLTQIDKRIFSSMPLNQIV